MNVPEPIPIAPPAEHCRIVFGHRTTPPPRLTSAETRVDPGSGTITPRSAKAAVSSSVMKPKDFRAASVRLAGSIIGRTSPMRAMMSLPFPPQCPRFEGT
jgi:hypothetical protein